jgi:flavin-binding protein dodecin
LSADRVFQHAIANGRRQRSLWKHCGNARRGDTSVKLGGGPTKEMNMKDPVYKLIELTGTSETSIEEAVENAIKRAHKTIKNLCWFQVVETRGNIEKGRVHHWQVTLKLGFSVDD